MATEAGQRTFALVVAVAKNGAIGSKGTLPWRLKNDMKFFRELTQTARQPTQRNAVIMGRRTWESIPAKFRPLPGRLNVVLTHQVASFESNSQDVLAAGSLSDGLQHVNQLGDAIDQIFVIGGGQVYREALDHALCQHVYLTRVLHDFPECDTFFPELDANAYRLATVLEHGHEDDMNYEICLYKRI